MFVSVPLLACQAAPPGAGGGSVKDIEHGPSTAPTGEPKAASPLGQSRISSFREAKKLLRTLYDEEPGPHVTIYEGCPFTKGRIDWSQCCYVPRDRKRLEWEHAVPAARFGGELSAWRDGHPSCVTKSRKRVHGRSCARLASPAFNRMEADLHNLFPAVGAINAARGHFPLGLVEGEPRAFGRCDFEVADARCEPRPEARGDLARAYLYMAAAYPEHVVLDAGERALYESWHRDDPPDSWEKRRNERIAVLQGNRSPFIAP